MPNSPKYRIMIQLLLAFSIVWIYAGSLVNFHQNRIWGKHMNPEMVAPLKQKEKKGILFSSKAGTGDEQGIDIQVFADLSAGQANPACRGCQTSFPLQETRPAPARVLVPNCLRGPPRG